MRLSMLERLAITFVACVFLGCGPVSSQDRQDDQRRVALVIGVSAYQHVQHLPNPTNDSKGVADALKRLNFDVLELRDPSLQALKDAQLDFIDRLIDADVALLYYAGHSIQIDGANFLIPVDAALSAQKDLETQTFEVARLINRMDRLAKIKIVVLDACRDNPFLDRARSALAGAGDGRQLGRGLARITDTGLTSRKTEEADTYGTIIAYAAAPGKTAADGDGRNSPYTAALLGALEEEGLEVGQMFRRVAAKVIAETRGAQKPEYLVKLSNEFYFLRPEPHQCDRLAIADYNQIGLPGVDIDKIRTKVAIPTCLDATRTDPGNPRFLHNLARAYDAAANFKTAVKYYRKSAALDFVPAINNLGVMFINGHGVKQDFKQGVTLLKQARSRGNKHARIALQTIDFSTVFEAREFKAVQKALRKSGHYSGKIDGAFGDGSKRALAVYQRTNGLARKGLTLETLDQLGLIGIIPNYSLN